jgi:N utilization substance protein B
VSTHQRSLAREFAFQFMFHLQLPIFEEKKASLTTNYQESELGLLYKEIKMTINAELALDQENFALTIIKATLKNYQSIQSLIEKNLTNWKLDRISKVDFTILLTALAELLYHKDTPDKVVINEAIELAKKFGSEESANFINGMVDRINKSKTND